jgi:hypothetical protein
MIRPVGQPSSSMCVRTYLCMSAQPDDTQPHTEISELDSEFLSSKRHHNKIFPKFYVVTAWGWEEVEGVKVSPVLGLC